MTTIRSLIRDIQVEVRDTDLLPDRAADLLAKLTALALTRGDGFPAVGHGDLPRRNEGDA